MNKLNDLLIYILLTMSFFSIVALADQIQKQSTAICDLEQRIINLEKANND